MAGYTGNCCLRKFTWTDAGRLRPDWDGRRGDWRGLGPDWDGPRGDWSWLGRELILCDGLC
eukprot:859890-Rhodomonas_salina.1